MLKNPEHRADLTKGVVAGGLTLIGLATGGGPLFTLLVGTVAGVGGNLLANVADRAIENWHRNWFSPEGVGKPSSTPFGSWKLIGNKKTNITT